VVDNKFCVQLAIIGHPITLDKVLEANDIGDCFLAELDQILVTWYLAFLGDLQTTTIAHHQESIFSLEYLRCKHLVATQIKG
jgi:hypothetical protein